MLIVGRLGPLHAASAVALLRGAGATAVTSVPFWLVSVQPLPPRRAAVVLLRVGAAAVPSKKFAVPKPTRSRISDDCAEEHAVEPPLQASAVVELARITLPAVPDIALVPLASTVGNAAPLAPLAMPTRKYWPGARVTFGRVAPTEKLPVPVALAYCTVMPLSETLALPRLNSST